MAAPLNTDEPLYSGEMRARADLTLAAILRALLGVLPVLIIAGLSASAVATGALAAFRCTLPAG